MSPQEALSALYVQAIDVAEPLEDQRQGQGWARIHREHTAAGGHWLDADTMAAFDTRIGRVFEGRVFAYSNATYDGTSRVYGVAVLLASGAIRHTSIPGANHILDAQDLAAALVKYLRTVA